MTKLTVLQALSNAFTIYAIIILVMAAFAGVVKLYSFLSDKLTKRGKK